MAEEKKKSIDQATLDMIEKAARDDCNIVFDRAETMKPCPIGAEGSCCSQCAMGPCRVPLPKGKEETPEDKKKRRGVCGATSETIAARNFLRKIAADLCQVVELTASVTLGCHSLLFTQYIEHYSNKKFL